MSKLILCAVLLLCLALSGSAVKTRKPYRIDETFFLQNNDDLMFAIGNLAEALCVQDKATDASPAAWLAAGKQCADSYRDEDVTQSSDDGGWHAYQQAAYQALVEMCGRVGAGYELCKWVGP